MLLLRRLQKHVPLLCKQLPCPTHVSDYTTEEIGTGLYQVLGVTRTAAAEEIKAAFRKRAKELHPDALQNDCNTADAKAFVQLVRAYEVLRDPYQRKMYDVASDTKLPGVLRQAAAAAAGAEETGSQQGDSTADPLGWRYGFGRWAKHGPSSYSPAVQYDGPALRYSLLNALHKYRMDLEKDLHAGLMTAFLGPE
eukprot:GHRR01030120.1.p1 GENE.GHRR01030120.1~~GHRR01030120.1.p1  ORF type:complete len:195 (+),score=61.32 GHRR01030120.1:169-753(+)